MSEPFEIKVGTIGRLIACDNCDCCYSPSLPSEQKHGVDWEPCDHGRNNRKLVEIIEQYEHEDPAMETPCFVVRNICSDETMDEVRMWDLARPAPLEQLALQAE